MDNLNPEPKNTQEGEAMTTYDISQLVEALTDESETLIGILYTIEKIGTFSRIDGQWKLASGDFQDDAEVVTSDETVISTTIKYDMAPELVQRFDSGETLTLKDLSQYEVLEDDEL